MALKQTIKKNSSYDLHYGPDEQRSRSVMTLAGVQAYERIYAGGVACPEQSRRKRQTLADGSTQEVYYISAPSGMAAIYVIEDSGQGKIYTPYQDHLGSIVAITDDNGDILQDSGQEVRMDFDPWGRHRDAATWDYETVSPLTDGSLPSWLWRGYTGHEHLDEFGLINMNGRCYDPLNGRMLAVDNYVSDATNTQAFNRYSYVLNNPLKYTDPSGESAILIGALISIVTNGISNAGAGRGFFIGAGKAALIGAISGGVASGIGGATTALFAGATTKIGAVAASSFQAIAHAGFGASVAHFSGGNVAASGLASLASSVVSSLVGLGAQNWSKANANAVMIAAGGLSGGLGSVIGGGDFWAGARNGLIVAGLNHGMHEVGDAIETSRIEKEIWQRIVKETKKFEALSIQTKYNANYEISEIFDLDKLLSLPNGSVPGGWGGGSIGFTTEIYEGEIVIGIVSQFSKGSASRGHARDLANPKVEGAFPHYEKGQNLTGFSNREGMYTYKYSYHVRDGYSSTGAYILFDNQVLFDTFLETIGYW